MKFSPEEKKQLVEEINNILATDISTFSVLPEHCTVEDVETASIESIHRSFNSDIPYSEKAYMAMAHRLALSGL